MSFHVIDLESGEPIRVDGAIQTFDTGVLAAEFAKDISNTSGKKHQPRRVATGAWREREQSRFKDGTYLKLPTVLTDPPWWRHHYNPDHFAHVALRDPTKIAFTESPDKGEADTQTAMKPGRYLKRFFPAMIDADADTIKAFCTEFARVFENNKLLISMDEEDFEEVYQNGPESCMQFVNETYAGNVHPARVYAAGDLGIAYLKRNGVITARAVVWPEKKTHCRIYGDVDRLSGLLTQAGYTWGPPIGAKLKRIPYDGLFVCPYIDAGTARGSGALSVRDAVTHLVICHPNYQYFATNRTDGVCEDNDGLYECDRCGDRVEDTVGVLDGCHRERFFCSNCTATHTTYCKDESITVISEAVVEMYDGDYWSIWRFREHGFTSTSGRRYPQSHQQLIMNNDGSYEPWGNDEDPTF